MFNNCLITNLTLHAYFNYSTNYEDLMRSSVYYIKRTCIILLFIAVGLRKTNYGNIHTWKNN